MAGSLANLLEERGEAIHLKCLHTALAPLPKEVARFYSSGGDRFQNPVGRIMADGVRSLVAWLADEADEEAMRSSLQEITQVLAIQDLPPSVALNFIFAMKDILIEERERFSKISLSSEELFVWEGRAQRLALCAFDLFSECRERIYKIRTDEVRARAFKLLERAGRTSEERKCEIGPDPLQAGT